MRIVIVGGHGKVALHLAPLLVARGHVVTSLIRNSAHAAEVDATGARAVLADVELLDVGEFTELLSDTDLVVWSAGAGGGNPSRTRAVDEHAAIRSFEAAVTAGVPRYLMVSYFGAGPDHGVAPESDFFTYADAKSMADEALQASALDWVILRPSALTHDAATDRIDVKQLHPEISAGRVSRSNVALLLAQIVDTPLSRMIVEFNDGATDIPEAVRELAALNL